MNEQANDTDALLDFRRAVGMLAAKMHTDVSRWNKQAEQHSVDYLIGELVTAWRQLQEGPAVAPTEGTRDGT